MDSTATYAPAPRLLYRSYAALWALVICAHLALTAVTHAAPLSSLAPFIDTVCAHQADESDDASNELLITTAGLLLLLVGRYTASRLPRRRFFVAFITGLHIRAPPVPAYV